MGLLLIPFLVKQEHFALRGRLPPFSALVVVFAPKRLARQLLVRRALIAPLARVHIYRALVEACVALVPVNQESVNQVLILALSFVFLAPRAIFVPEIHLCRRLAPRELTVFKTELFG